MRFNLFNGKQVEMVQFQVTPDRETHNKKSQDLFRGLSTFYTSPLDVLRGKTSGAFWWDVVIEHDSIKFLATFPAEWAREVLSLLNNTWEGCSLEQTDCKQAVLPLSADVCEMKYRRSDLFALKVDNRTEIEPLNSILSIAADLKEGDKARYSICAEPVSRLDWQEHAERLQKEFRDGKTPKRRRISKKDALISVGELITNVLQSLMDGLYTIVGGYDVKKERYDDREKRLLMLDGLDRGTVNKSRSPVFNAYIRIASYSENLQRQKVTMRSIANSFNDLTAENELERHDYNRKLKPTVIQELNTFKISWATRLDFDKNKMSNEELGRLAETPTAALQDKYKEIECLDTRQVDVPAILLKGGIPLGTVEYKKQTKEVFFPIKDHDQLCLPSVVIGGMGSGKTKGFASNRAVDFVKSGYSSVIFDPKKSEVWALIEKGLPKEQRKRFLLGEQLISLDFREALHSKSARNRLAQIIMKFFEDNSDAAGAQTQRFIKAAVFAMKTGRLKEIITIFENDKYRNEVILDLPADSMHRITLEQFGKEKPDRQRQILSPIYNRLDVILGDSYLTDCMNATEGIDMVEVLSRKEVCTVFDLPDRLNSREAKDILVNLLSFKIDLAMGLRKEEFPVSIIYDEPHQYLRSVDLWKKVAVESRAYRLSYTWLFHSWEQIPNDLAQIIKDAGCHYFIYPSSEGTYKGLQRVIAPFTIEDGMKTKRHHAICAMRAGDSHLTPIMIHMKPPV